MTVWPHLWIAYFAGCRCTDCLRFDRRVFERGGYPDRTSPTGIGIGEGEPTIAIVKGGASS